MSRALAVLLILSGAAAARAAQCTPRIEWVWDGPSQGGGFPEPCVTPLVLQVTDDNADGRIDAADRPDVVFVHSSASVYEGRITALDGATGVEHWTAAGVGVLPTGLAAGDIDGDGLVEILALAADRGHVVALEHDGTSKWTSAPAALPLYEFDAMGIADLDQDGSPEIYSGAQVWNADGSFRFLGTAGAGVEGWWNLIHISNAADLVAASPGLELLAGNTAYDPQGAVVWQNASLPDGFTAVGDLDGDGRPEVVLATTSELWALDGATGAALGAPRVVAGRVLAQPVIADLDGGGGVEVAAINDYLLEVLRWDGAAWTLVWSAVVNDDTRLNGASAFDLDGDGAAELFYHDSFEWYIFDGRSGTVLSSLAFNSATTIETPVIADLDGDCVSEILVTGCQGGIPYPSPNQVIAYECAGSRPARPMWNQYGYHVTNVEDDGRIPRVEPAHWLAGGGWQEQAGGTGGVARAGPDASVCEGVAVTLDGAASLLPACSSGLLYEWRQGAAVLRAASPVPTWSPPTAAPGTSSYTLAVWCAGAPLCAVTDEVVVEVRDCTIAVVFGDFAARRVPGGVEIAWSTLSESGTLCFEVERAASAQGPFAPAAACVPAQGAWRPYRVIDARPGAWYRVVERTTWGRGDSTAPFAVAAPPGGRAGGGRRRARR